MIPYFSDGSEEYNIKVEYDDLQLLSSASIINTNGFSVFDKKKIHLFIKIKDFMTSFFIIGSKINIIDESQYVDLGKFYILYIGDEVQKYKNQDLISATKRIIEEQCELYSCRRYEKELHGNNFIILANSSSLHQRSFHRDNLSVLRFDDTEVYFSKRRLLHLIAHGNMYTFLGHDKIAVFEPESDKCDLPESRWFTEGFNEYLSRYFALESGTITLEEYVLAINSIITKYYIMFAQSLGSKFQWLLDADGTDTPVLLQYLHGELLALSLNSMLEEKTNNKVNLYDLLYQLVRTKCKSLNCSLTLQDFAEGFSHLVTDTNGSYAVAKKNVEEEIYGHLKSYVDYKKHIILPEKILHNKASLAYKKFKVIDLTLIDNILKQLNEKRPKLGVSSKITKYNFDWSIDKCSEDECNKPNIDAVLTIHMLNENGKREKVRYRPLKDHMIPQYYLLN